MVKWDFRCEALFPPPLPSSSTSFSGRSAASVMRRRYSPASSAYSSGAVIRWNQDASSRYILGSGLIVYPGRANDTLAGASRKAPSRSASSSIPFR
jgi:hypothetical protein